MSDQNEILEIYMVDDIVICIFLLDKTITEEIAWFTIKERLRIAEGKPHKALIVYKNKTTLSFEASKAYASEEGQKGLLAAAIVCYNPITRYLASFFSLAVPKKDSLPMKIFKNEKSAEEWLRKLEL